MKPQISSLSSVALSTPLDLVRGNATTMPCVNHRSVCVHFRGCDLGSQLWTATSRGVIRYSIGGGYSLRWSDREVHYRRPANALEVTLDVVCLRFVHTDHVLFPTGLNRCFHRLLAFPQRGSGDDTSRWVTEGSRSDRVLQIVGGTISILHNFPSDPPQPDCHIKLTL